jgi:ubiquinone/menaquinone biosynthesis C-methylase UbiE
VLSQILRQRHAVALQFIDELPLSKGSRVLEIGCGTGLLALSLAKKGFTVNAVDHAVAMVERTKKLIHEKNMNGTVFASVEDAHKFTFEDNSFDLIVAIGVIHWLHNLKQALSEITRVLKPQGYAVLSIDTRWISQIDFPFIARAIIKSKLQQIGLLTQPSNRNAGPVWYSTKQFNQYLSETKLKLIKRKTFGFLPFNLFNKQLLSERNSLKISLTLQRYADAGYPILRSHGAIYLVLLRNRK